jgi:hypothetical protein
MLRPSSLDEPQLIVCFEYRGIDCAANRRIAIRIAKAFMDLAGNERYAVEP